MALGAEKSGHLRSVSERISKLARQKPDDRRPNASRFARLSPRAQAFQKLLSARDAIRLVIDSTGAIQRISIVDSDELNDLCGTLTGQRLPQLFDSHAYRMLADACERGAQAGTPQEMGCLLQASSSFQWFAVLIRPLPGRQRGKPLFSIFIRRPSA